MAEVSGHETGERIIPGHPSQGLSSEAFIKASRLDLID
jgi:hypothetical protein